MKRLLIVAVSGILSFFGLFAAAQEATAIQPDIQVGELIRRAGYAHRTEEEEEHVLDAAVFTDISPFSVDESAVKLPPDQQLPD